MLIKLGDTWIDPTRVIAIEPEDTDVVCESADKEAGEVVFGGVRRENPGCRVVLEAYTVVYVHEVSADEAAQRINACREQAIAREALR